MHDKRELGQRLRQLESDLMWVVVVQTVTLAATIGFGFAALFGGSR